MARFFLCRLFFMAWPFCVHISHLLANFIFLVDNLNFTALIWRRMLNLVICHLMNARAIHNAYEHVHYREPVTLAGLWACVGVYFNSMIFDSVGCLYVLFFYLIELLHALYTGQQEKLANAKRKKTKKKTT